MMRIAVCDDVNAICTELENIILDFKEQEGIKLTVDVFYSGETLIDYMKLDNTFDLIFLDIEMGEINGVQVGRYLRDELKDYIVKIVYISSKNGYDRQLFDVQPFNFLPKPLDRKKVGSVIRLAMKYLEIENNIFSFKSDGHTYRLPVKDIIYFENYGRKMKLISSKDTYEFYGTVNSVMDKLPKSRFFIPERSYIVNYENVAKIKKNQIEMCNKDHITISKQRAKAVMEFQIAYEEGKRNL